VGYKRFELDTIEHRVEAACCVMCYRPSHRNGPNWAVLFWPDDGPCGCVLQFSLGSDSVQFCRYTATFRKNMLLPSSGLRYWFHLDAAITAVRYVQWQDRGQSEPHTELTTSWFPRPEDWGSMFLRNVDIKSQRLRRKPENLDTLFEITSEIKEGCDIRKH